MELSTALAEASDEAAAGQAQAATELDAAFAACRRRAYWIALDIVHDRDEAADVVHESYVRARRALAGFRREASPRTYLLRAVVNLALKVARRRRVRERLRHLLAIGGRPPATPEHLAGCAEATRRLASALERLPAQQRAAFLLRHAHDLPLAEVAQLLGVSEGTAKTHLARAVERLRHELVEGPR